MIPVVIPPSVTSIVWFTAAWAIPLVFVLFGREVRS